MSTWLHFCSQVDFKVDENESKRIMVFLMRNKSNTRRPNGVSDPQTGLLITIFGLSFCRFSFSLWSSFSSRRVQPTKVCPFLPGRGSQDLFLFNCSSSENRIKHHIQKQPQKNSKKSCKFISKLLIPGPKVIKTLPRNLQKNNSCFASLLNQIFLFSGPLRTSETYV